MSCLRSPNEVGPVNDRAKFPTPETRSRRFNPENYKRLAKFALRERERERGVYVLIREIGNENENYASLPENWKIEDALIARHHFLTTLIYLKRITVFSERCSLVNP